MFTNILKKAAFITVLVLVGTVSLSALADSKQTATMKKHGAAGMTAQELHIWVDAFAVRLPGAIEEAANEVMDNNNDIKVIKNAIKFQLYGINAFQKAIFHSDPFVALVDMWVLTSQMIDFYQTGAGKEYFGNRQGLVIDELNDLRGRLESMLSAVFGKEDIKSDLAWMNDWVDEHPLTGNLFVRDSVITVVAKIQASAKKKGVFSSIQNVGENVERLQTRIALFAEIIPQMMIWQIELIFLDLQDEESQYSLKAIDDFVAGLIEKSFEAFEKQRIEALEDMERILADGIKLASSDAKNIIDYIVLRMILLIVITFIFALIFFLIYKKAKRP